MSRRYQAGFIRPGYDPLKVANAPTIGTAADSKTDGSVKVAFTAPSCVGGGAITSYTAVANCGSKFGSGSSSPITVTGLTNCTAYTFTVYATNAYGPSAYSASSNSVTPTKPVVGQQAYTTAGTYSWVAPTGVTKVSVVAVGSGASGGSNIGGGGGSLGYKNNISVTPGSSYSVIVAAKNCRFSSSYFINKCTVNAPSGSPFGCATPTYTGDGGGKGGTGGVFPNGGGGGAGGYAGNGGNGGYGCFCNSGGAGAAGVGGGGGGGGGGAYGAMGGGGGGVGILGQGTNGTGGQSGTCSQNAGGGTGGSGGCNGKAAGSGSTGGKYGGGDGGGAGGGTVGAVRIIWPGCMRSFPSTCTGDK